MALLPWAWAWAEALDNLGHPSVLKTVLVAFGLAAAFTLWRGRSLRAPGEAWVLRFDGEHWHWWAHSNAVSQESSAALASHSQPTSAGSAQGCGHLHHALSIGPWWLLKARPAAGHGQGRVAWIWLRADALGREGRRLRALLAWS